MGIHKPTYTLPLPPGATVKKDTVNWTDAKGERKTGRLTSAGRVLVESKYWQIRYRDESGVERREATNVKNREAAARILAQREAEVERIVSGLATREETKRAEARHEPLSEQERLAGHCRLRQIPVCFEVGGLPEAKSATFRGERFEDLFVGEIDAESFENAVTELLNGIDFEFSHTVFFFASCEFSEFDRVARSRGRSRTRRSPRVLRRAGRIGRNLVEFEHGGYS